MENSKAINIGQRVFLFDIDAYEKFNLYHKMIKDHFSRYSDFEKKIEDIEFKIADLFDLQLQQKETLSFTDIENVIDKIGLSSDWDKLYDDEGEGYNQSTHNRLYRSTKDSVISGVCGGLAVYLKTDAIYIRIATVIMALFLAVFPVVFAYLIIWYIVPTDNELERRIPSKKENTAFKNAAAKSGNFAIKFMGVILLIISGLMIVSLYFGLSYAYYSLDLNLIEVNVIDASSQDFLITSFIIVVSGPFILLLMLAIRMLKDSPYPKYTWMTATIVWFACIFSTVFYAQKMFHEFYEEASIKKVVEMDKFDQDFIVINTGFSSKDDDIDFLLPEIRLNSKSTDKVTIWMRYTALGQTREIAKNNASLIKFEPFIEGNQITIPGKIDISKNPYFRFQEVKLWIDIPYGLDVEINNFNRYRFEMRNPRGSRFDRNDLPKFVKHITFESTEKGLIVSK